MLYSVKGEAPEEYYRVPLYKADIEREGSDVTTVGLQTTLPLAYKAVKQLAAKCVGADSCPSRITMRQYNRCVVLQIVPYTQFTG